MTAPGVLLTILTSLPLDAPHPGPVPVVLTTDCGAETDDQWALTHLAVSPRVDLRVVVTGHAPGLTPERSSRTAREVLDRLPAARRRPVVPGSARPMGPGGGAVPGPGVDAILNACRDGTPDRRVALVVIGAATDAASALLTDPTLADRVELVTMAFNGWPGGGDPWNVKNDPAAWRVLLASRAPLVVGDAAVCKRHLVVSESDAVERLGGRGPRADGLVADLRAWVRKEPKLCEAESGSATAWPIWDEVTVAHLLGLTKTEDHPRPALRDDLSFDHAGGRGTLRWVTAVDSEALWRDLSVHLRATSSQ